MSLSSVAGNGNITLSGAVDGAQNLSLAAGTGNITLSGAVGGTTRLGALTVVSAGNVTAGAITATSLTQSAGTGTTTFGGAVDLTGNLSFTGSALTVNAAVTAGGTVTVTNAGLFTTAAAGDIFSTGAFLQNGAGTSSLAGDIVTGDANLQLNRAVDLAGPVLLRTGAAGAGNIVLNSTVNGAQSLTLTAGTGNISTRAVGNLTPLTSVTVTSAANVNLLGAVTAGSFTQTAGTGVTTLRGVTTTVGGVSVTTGTVTVLAPPIVSAGAVSLTGSVGVNLGANITATNAAVTVTGAATLTADVVVTAGTGAVTFTGAVNGAKALSVSASGQTWFQGNVGAMTALTSLTLNGGGSTRMDGTVVTTTGAQTYHDDMVFASNVTLTTTNSAIGFSGAVDGATAYGQDLTVAAGTGAVTFTGAVGGTTALDAITIVSAGNVTAGAVTAASLTQSAGTGTTTLGGVVSLTGGLSFTGNALTVNAGVTAGGAVSVANAGLFTTAAAGDITALSFAQTGAGTNSLAGDITATSGSVSLATAASLTGAVSLSSAAGNGNITLSGAVDGAQALSLAAGNGTVAFNGALGAVTPLTGLTVSSSGTTTFSSALTTNGPVSLTATTLNLGFAIATNGSNITLAADNLAISAAVNAGAGTVTMTTRTATNAIDLGGAGGAGVTGISAAEVAQVTASRLLVGTVANTGGISVTDTIALGTMNFTATTAGAITFASAGTLSGNIASTDVVLTGSSVTGGADLTSDVVAGSLTVTATAGGIGALGAALRFEVNTLSTNSTATNGSQYLAQNAAYACTVGAGDINAGTGAIFLTKGRFITAVGSDILSAVTVSAGVTLGGTGSTGAVNVLDGGFFSPGAATGPQVGDLTVNGSVTLNSSSNFNTYLGKTGSTTTAGRVVATGAVNLNGAALNIAGYAGSVTVGDKFTLVTAGSVTGLFSYLGSLLTNNSTFTYGALTFKITYTATEVSLEVVNPA